MSSTPVRLKLFTAMSVVIGCVIGSGVFVKPGRVLIAAGGSTQAIMAWVLGGVMTLAAGLTVAEVASRIPKTGGVYVYIEELYGRSVGFVSGWVQAVIYGPGLMAALALYFGSLFVQFFTLSSEAQKPVALLTLFALATVSAVSTRYSAWIQNATTLIKLMPILLIGVLGLFLGHETIFGVALPENTAAAGMGAAILSTLWAYDGWMQVGNIAGELDNPAKNLPRAIVFGLLTVMAAYLLVNISLFHILDKTQITLLNEKAAGAAAEMLIGPIGGGLLSLGILISIFGALNGNILTLTRVPYAIALRGVFPYRERFSSLHPKFQTPVNSIVLKATLAAVMISLFNPDRITDIAIFSMYVFYSLVFIGIFKIRKQYGVPAAGQYKVPLYPVIPLAAFAGCMYICYGMLKQAPWDGVISLAVALAGFPVYWVLTRMASRKVQAAVEPLIP